MDNYPLLQCFFECGNEAQKNYCIKLKDNFSHYKAIKFIIKSQPYSSFSINFIKNNKRYRIQSKYDDSDECLNESLNKMYKILDEEDIKDILPTLECFYPKGNETQKKYYYKLKENFKFEKPINFEIQSSTDQSFEINFIKNNNFYEIQKDFSNKSLNAALNKIYSLYDEEAKNKEDKSES